MRELLTGYGPLGVIWFDTPFTISREQSEELYNLVRELQPGCIMNSRLGNGLGDYQSAGDNRIPVARRAPRLGNAGHDQPHLGLQVVRPGLEIARDAGAQPDRHRQQRAATTC